MLTLAEVQESLTPYFRPIAAYVRQIANLYVPHDAEYQSWLQHMIIPEAAQNAAGGTPADYRGAFIESCDGWGMPEQVAQQIMLLPLPVVAAPPPPVAVIPAPPVDYRAHYAAEIARLAQLRTNTSTQHGRLLAQAATQMQNWFHWVPSGPREAGFFGQQGMVYGPKTAWTRTRTDVGVDQHAQKLNHFASWLIDNGAQPNQLSHMNCWESVLMSAFRAALADKVKLQTMHRKAASVNEMHHRAFGDGAGASAGHYFRSLSFALGFYASVPFEPRAGLIPREGDVLYWDRDNHVAISLGRTWNSGQPTDHIMSLWHHNGASFARITLEDMPGWMAPTLRFRPCPF
jgi:hypothetical protein